MIEIKNVSKIYDGIRAVNQLNLTVRDGEIFVLLGSSGCGKSTTLNMINRLIEPTEGNIYIDGKDIKDFKTLKSSGEVLGMWFREQDCFRI